MKIQDIGGEFALIDRLARQSHVSHPDLLTGVGDDAAVIAGPAPHADHLLVTTDMLIEKRHFRCDWASPEQIGIKSVVCNLSDIAAMGGTPTFMFVSLALTEKTDVEWVDALYQGMAAACQDYHVVLAGGDTTQGTAITISIALLGRVSPHDLCLRSHALPGDRLCVTGPLGGSAAGLAMLAASLTPPEYLQEKHLAPGCRLDVAPQIAPFAHAMIDISDGLSSEILHLCEQSDVGCNVYEDKIPLDPTVISTSEEFKMDSTMIALSGGEDYELLFTIDQKEFPKIKGNPNLTVLGHMTHKNVGAHLISRNGSKIPLTAQGWNSFTSD